MTTHPSPRVPIPDAERLEQRFSHRLEELRTSLAPADPARLAQHTTARIESLDQGGQLHLSLWGRPMYITFPEYIVHHADTHIHANPLEQAMLLYHLTAVDGTPLSGEWKSFADLPDGRFYNQAFQGYTGQELARAFGNDRFAFDHAAQALGGESYPLADAAYILRPLPLTPILAVYWQGDEDFPSSCQLLFDSAASHFLPTDGYAILGAFLTRKLIRQSQSRP